MITPTYTLPLITQEALINGCISGRADYQRILFHKYAPTMFAVCLRYAPDYHQAEDYLQEGFIKVFNKLHQYANKGSFEGWLRTIFVNNSIEVLRKNKKWYELFPNDQSPQLVSTPNILDHLATQELLQCIQKLPDGYRTIFNLYVIEGYAHKEISKMMKISEGTSKSQLSRARTALQRIIATREIQLENI